MQRAVLENLEEDLDAELVEQSAVATPSGGAIRAACIRVGELSHLKGRLTRCLCTAR